MQNCIIVVARTERVLDDESKQKMTDFLKVRLNDSTVVVLNALK